MNTHTNSTLQDCPINIEKLIQLEQEAAAPVIKWTRLCNISLITVLLICIGIFFSSSGDIEIQIGAAIAFFLTMAFIIFNYLSIRGIEERPMQILMSLNAYKYKFKNQTDDKENNP